MLLILTDRFDVHADFVIKKLDEKNIEYFRLNLDVESLRNTHCTFENFTWYIDTEDSSFVSREISCVWCRRPFMELTLQEQSIQDVDFKIWKNEWNKTLLGLQNSLKHLPWLNPLRKAYKGENKYYQMDVARDVGFNFPPTLITNDKRRVLEFAEQHNQVLFKLMTQEMYEMGENDFKGLFTNVVSREAFHEFGNIGENPLVLQKYIDKKYEVRYTIIGNEHLACKIDSQCSDKAKLDWRHYDIIHTPHVKIEPPSEIKEKASKMMEILGLEYGALDFIVTPEDEWFFLEINCMGQWLWIEQLTGMPISDAIIKWIYHNIKKGELT